MQPNIFTTQIYDIIIPSDVIVPKDSSQYEDQEQCEIMKESVNFTNKCDNQVEPNTTFNLEKLTHLFIVMELGETDLDDLL